MSDVGRFRRLVEGGQDIQALAKPILRHRIMTNFYAESERITADNLVLLKLRWLVHLAADDWKGAVAVAIGAIASRWGKKPLCVVLVVVV